ncbi:MAG: ribbon-helix-helix protein, CopG family [Chloroflexi bacterium]|nr:MAG: ribbon-helix-helix protein, CopG family [Chloroflexota bacterium]
MKTIQITIDEELLQQVDQATQMAKMTRSQFICKALEEALYRLKIEELEQKHIKGYRDYPVTSGEFDVWESEQAWGKE